MHDLHAESAHQGGDVLLGFAAPPESAGRANSPVGSTQRLTGALEHLDAMAPIAQQCRLLGHRALLPAALAVAIVQQQDDHGLLKPRLFGS